MTRLISCSLIQTNLQYVLLMLNRRSVATRNRTVHKIIFFIFCEIDFFTCDLTYYRRNDDGDMIAAGLTRVIKSSWKCPVLQINCLSIHIYEPRCEKTDLRGFRPGPTQIRLYRHRRWQEA